MASGLPEPMDVPEQEEPANHSRVAPEPSGTESMMASGAGGLFAQNAAMLLDADVGGTATGSTFSWMEPHRLLTQLVTVLRVRAK